MTSGKRLVVALGIGALVLLGSLSTAHAQYGAPPSYFGPSPSRGFYRSGLVIGFGLGVGDISADDCGTCGGAGGLEFHIGGMLTPRLAALFEVWGLGRPVDGGGTLTNSIATGALQLWLNDFFWLKGGIGVGTIRLSSSGGYNIDDESAFGVSFAGGFEVMQAPGFALDLQLRFAHMSYAFNGANNLALMVGFNWY
jgi:hypothetical protein